MQEKIFVGGVNDRLAAQAARWYARLRAPDFGPEEQDAFDSWLQADESHRRAFEAASFTAQAVSTALTQDARLRALLEADLASEAKRRSSRNEWRRVGFAAAWLAAIGLAVFVARPWFVTTEPVESLFSYANSEHREQTIQLTDGSVMHLDAESEVSVVMSGERRRITLHNGRAYFEVAHDRERPFSVEAAGTRTVALGTRFEVRMQEQQVVVTLAEGSVAVTPANGAAEWHETLVPGEQLVYDGASRRSEKRSVDAAKVIAWSAGRLLFDGVPLAQVLDDVNRYSGIKVVLGDESLAGIPIGGTFAAGGDAGAFVQALSAILPLRSEPSGDNQIVLFRRERVVVTN